MRLKLKIFHLMNGESKTISNCGLYVCIYHIILSILPHCIKNALLQKQGFKPCTIDSNLTLAYVYPDDISYKLSVDVPDRRQKAMVGTAGGSWDKVRYDFEKHIVYKSFNTYFLKKKDWDETLEYKRKLIKSGHKSGINKKKKYEHLYTNMKNSGYKTQVELYEESSKDMKNFQIKLGELELPDEIRVAVDRNGELLHVRGGKHRLAMAKILNYDCRIPVIVQFRHSDANLCRSLTNTKTLTPSHPLVNRN